MGQGIAQITVFVIVLIVAAYPLGLYMARVFADEDASAPRPPAFPGRGRARLPARSRRPRGRGADMEGVRAHAARLQPALHGRPLRDPAPAGAPVPESRALHRRPSQISFNTAASFVTNTNWQFYAGESTMSFLSQMAGLAVQNFVSAAVGIAVMVAVFRGFSRRRRRRSATSGATSTAPSPTSCCRSRSSAP